MTTYEFNGVKLLNGDCLSVLKTLDDSSVDAVVTDPPAGIGFMGKKWDTFDRDRFIEFLSHRMRECLRILKPGGYAVVWSIPRTSHWTGTAMEDAGFEIRDVVLHLFGSGFPKSLDVSKAIDGVLGKQAKGFNCKGGNLPSNDGSSFRSDHPEYQEYSPATDAAKQWNGWGTALKPAAEFWWLCRKPLEGTVAENVQKWGTGGLNIDGCRVPLQETGEDSRLGGKGQWNITREQSTHTVSLPPSVINSSPLGRWPANVTHDGSDEVLAEFERQSKERGLGRADFVRSGRKFTGWKAHGELEKREAPSWVGENSGNVSRFFYCAKASKSERGRSNDHPTVKPIELMKYLCRLVTPPGGLVLDCFAGSGSTLIAAREEGFRAIGIERESHYCDIIAHRLRQGVISAA